MQFIINGVSAFLMAYLAFTNTIASHIANLIDATPRGNETVMTSESSSKNTPSAGIVPDMTPLNSSFSWIPDVLIKNAAYQEALVIGSTLPQAEYVSPKDGIVNIYCTFTTKKTIRTTTGTGFFVDPRGVIMTNAHVAQFLLLGKTEALGDASCTIRTGSPASARYTADLLYIPPAWVADHASLVSTSSPTGTGERDYALLYVTGTVDSSPLPAAFPALTLATEPLTIRSVAHAVVAAGYPAGFPGEDMAVNLNAHLATTTISQIFTFGHNQPDVIAIKGSSVGHQGASGGPIVNEAGEVIGMIATRGNDAMDGEGSLRAITISHIDHTITEETGASLYSNIATNIDARATIFNKTMTPFLTSLLTKEINRD